MTKCVTCGTELHPERAKKYNYCMAPDCQEKNLRGLTMVAVGVNKSAEQYMLLDEETRTELAEGKYHDQRRGTFGKSLAAPGAPATENVQTPGPAMPDPATSGLATPRPATSGLATPRPVGPGAAGSGAAGSGAAGSGAAGSGAAPSCGPGASGRATSRPGTPSSAAPGTLPSSARARPPWTRSQQKLALLYNQQGLRPEEIARKLGLSRYTVTQIILAGRGQGKL
jgi:hypothetical protein